MAAALWSSIMEKHHLTAIEMLDIAAQHAYVADHLLQNKGEVQIDSHLKSEALLAVVALLHLAFEITLKAFLLHEKGKIPHFKNLNELVQANAQLNLNSEDKTLLHTLARQYAYRKGLDYALWDNRQQQHVFCEQALNFYARLIKMTPLELQADYNS